MTPEEVWRRKSDDDLLAARATLHEYTEAGQRIVLAEIERRGLSKDQVESADGPDLHARAAPTIPARRWWAIVVSGALFVGLGAQAGLRFMEAERLRDATVRQFEQAEQQFASDQDAAVEAGNVNMNRAGALMTDRDHELRIALWLALAALFSGMFGIMLFATRRNALP
jgi:hypothetical protein